MAYEEKYVKLLEERVEELQQRLSVEEKKHAPSMAGDELIVKYLACVLETNSNGIIPVTYRWNTAKCTLKAENSTKVLYRISKGLVEVDQKYIDMIKEALKKLEV